MKNGGTMDKQERIKGVFLYGVFICYILLLIKILLLSRNLHSELRSINLIPFYSIMEYISGSVANLKTFAFGNVIGNIIIFIPLGIYLTLFKNDKRVKTNLLFIFIMSLFVEIIQGLLGIGAADIDDIILNCLGGLIGILGYKFLLFILRDEKKTYTAITILSAIGLPCILYYLFIVRMRF
jgi:glycopeptide antibiotics resistance protein